MKSKNKKTVKKETIFKNKVGRPTNDVLKKRKIFYSVILIIIIFFVGFLLTKFNIIRNKGLKANIANVNSKNFIINVEMTNGDGLSKTKITKGYKYEKNAYGYGEYGVNININNISPETLYGRWFTYASDDTSVNPTYASPSCNTLGLYNSTPSISFSSASDNKRAGRYKIYSSLKSCEDDKYAKKTKDVYKDYIAVYKLNSSKEKLNVEITKLAGTVNSSGVIPLKAGSHDVSFKIINETNSKKYYRWALYKDLVKNPGNIIYDGGCVAFNKTGDRTYRATISDELPARIGVLRVYDTELQCRNDANLNNTYVNEKQFTYIVNSNKAMLSVSKVGNGFSFDSNNLATVTKTGTYYITYTLNNLTDKTYYYNWFTYNSLDYNAKATYGEPKNCGSYSKTYTTKPSLGVTGSKNLRAGKMKIYSSLDACKKDTDGKSTSDVISTNPVKIKFNGIIKINYDLKGISTKVGSQKKKLCWSSAMAYGVYIISNGSKIASKSSTVYSSYKVGKYTAKTLSSGNKTKLYQTIRNNINNGLPVVIHVYGPDSSGHWVTVVGYNGAKESASKMTLDDVYIIDPFNGYNNYSKLLYNDKASLRRTSSSLYSDYVVSGWSK